MEEDIVDKFSYQYPDHPKLLQIEQPFAQILSAAATTASIAQESSTPGVLSSALMPRQDNNKDIIVSGFLFSEVQDPAFLNGTDTVECNSTLYPSESSNSLDMLPNMAFFKGMKEANMFLPKDNRMVDVRRRKNRFDMDGGTEAGMGRSSKQIAVLVHTDSEEEAELKKMLDQLILSGDDMYASEMKEVLITLDKENKGAQKSFRMRGRRGLKQPVMNDLETMLIRCAEAVASNDHCSASDLLERIKRHSSPKGNARQRLAHYFAQGLEARLAGTGSELYHSLFGTCTITVELMKAYHLSYTTPVAGRRKLHIVHYGINTGLQWPDLIQWLADREGGPPEVRMTSITGPQPGFRTSEQIEEAGHRLCNYASKFGMSFNFHTIAVKTDAVRAEDLHIDPDEVPVVNSLFQFRALMDESLTFDRVNPRDTVLNSIRKMKPNVFVHAVTNGPYSGAFFMTRFRHALYNFTALFDMMETMLERDLFARCAMNMIACEGADRVERPQNYREWQTRNNRAGLRQLPLDHDIVLTLKSKVKNQYHTHFMINEDHQWLLQGWKGRPLYALSTWTADDAADLSNS
ncbi:hypothetical protein BRADI_4g09138v3 [Brachypodium distachyon]|uniref:Uncharacterized protein n=1 Tax=Brachypodium distachyon TaxID=15368 RepID=A0A0Q3H117_BRADI|nr:hypothetical protein BRADI_4g09138v3 [Brachypodium distachyon]